ETECKCTYLGPNAGGRRARLHLSLRAARSRAVTLPRRAFARASFRPRGRTIPTRSGRTIARSRRALPPPPPTTPPPPSAAPFPRRGPFSAPSRDHAGAPAGALRSRDREGQSRSETKNGPGRGRVPRAVPSRRLPAAAPAGREYSALPAARFAGLFGLP